MLVCTAGSVSIAGVRTALGGERVRLRVCLAKLRKLLPQGIQSLLLCEYRFICSLQLPRRLHSCLFVAALALRGAITLLTNF
jgi:hypothetical protein